MRAPFWLIIEPEAETLNHYRRAPKGISRRAAVGPKENLNSLSKHVAAKRSAQVRYPGEKKIK